MYLTDIFFLKPGPGLCYWWLESSIWISSMTLNTLDSKIVLLSFPVNLFFYQFSLQNNDRTIHLNHKAKNLERLLTLPLLTAPVFPSHRKFFTSPINDWILQGGRGRWKLWPWSQHSALQTLYSAETTFLHLFFFSIGEVLGDLGSTQPLMSQRLSSSRGSVNKTEECDPSSSAAGLTVSGYAQVLWAVAPQPV